MRGRWKKSVLAVLGLGTCLWSIEVEAGSASNVFVTVESASGIVENAGDGFSVESSGEVRITPRRDWRLVSPPGGRAFVAPGRPAAWKVVSYLGEDTKSGGVHRCSFLVTTNVTHVSAPELAASSAPVGPFVYTRPATGVDVAVGFAAGQVTNGVHRIETTWEDCECGKKHEPSSETDEMPVNFGSYEWAVSSGSQSGQSCTITLPNKAKGQHSVSATVTASVGGCEGCKRTCTATNSFTVSELSVACPAWIGINRTDDGPDRTGISATATLDPKLEDAECAWEYSGVCEPVVESTNPYQYNLTVTNGNVASEKYLSEEVKATVLGCTAVTNFTVVKVDVAIDGASEDDEEKVGAFVRHVADAGESGLWTSEGTNALVAVSVTCEPKDLPAKERISVTGSDGYLFERKNGVYEEIRGAVEYPASEIGGKAFYLHGHEVSSELKDREVSAKHGTSGATDKSKFTVAKTAIKEVSFSGDNTVLKSDDGAVTFSAPQYKDVNLDGDANDEGDRSFPISYVRNSSNVIVSAKFIMIPKPSGKVLLKATGGGGFPMNLEPIAVSGDGTEIALPPTQMSGKLDNKIACLKGMSINWFVSVDNGANWIGMGQSTNALYVTWSKPCAPENLQTYFEVGCAAANGVTGIVGVNDDSVLDKIWGKFKSKNISRVSDGKVLTYYGFDDVNGNGVWDEGIDIDKNRTKVTDAVALIKEGNGQCYSWAEFLGQVLCAQGLNAINSAENNLIWIEHNNLQNDKVRLFGFAVKNWGKAGVGPWYVKSFDAGLDGRNITLLIDGQTQDIMGIRGQGNSPNPPAWFERHFILKLNGLLYDPSYGTGPFNSYLQYESQSFEGCLFVRDERDCYLVKPSTNQLMNSCREYPLRTLRKE